jgi:hypothetical protein
VANKLIKKIKEIPLLTRLAKRFQVAWVKAAIKTRAKARKVNVWYLKKKDERNPLNLFPLGF